MHTPVARVRLPRKKAAANRTFLTEEKVAALPARKKDYLVWDASGRGGDNAVRGLHVHVLPSGTKSYRFMFRLKGAKQPVSYRLGRWPGLSLAEAREKAIAAHKAVAKGHRPQDS